MNWTFTSGFGGSVNVPTEFILQLAPGTPSLTDGALTGAGLPGGLGLAVPITGPGPFTVNFVFEAGGTDVSDYFKPNGCGFGQHCELVTLNTRVRTRLLYCYRRRTPRPHEPTSENPEYSRGASQSSENRSAHVGNAAPPGD